MDSRDTALGALLLALGRYTADGAAVGGFTAVELCSAVRER